MTSDYVIISVKFYPEVGHDEYIVLFNFGSRIISGFEGKEGEPSEGEAKESPVSIGLNANML